MSPTGVFECRVPPTGGGAGALVVARITIGQYSYTTIHELHSY
jgi:hypothetical protein